MTREWFPAWMLLEESGLAAALAPRRTDDDPSRAFDVPRCRCWPIRVWMDTELNSAVRSRPSTRVCWSDFSPSGREPQRLCRYRGRKANRRASHRPSCHGARCDAIHTPNNRGPILRFRHGYAPIRHRLNSAPYGLMTDATKRRTGCAVEWLRVSNRDYAARVLREDVGGRMREWIRPDRLVRWANQPKSNMRHAPAITHKTPEQRWATIFATTASAILNFVVLPPRVSMVLARRLELLLLHEADLNRSRQQLLERVERGAAGA